MPLKSMRPAQASFCQLIIALLLVMAIPLTVFSQQKTPPSGEYITEKGLGHLTIKRSNAGTTGFTIMAMDANGRVCDLDGEIRKGRAELESSKQGKPCIVTFTQKGNDIDVDSGTYNECRDYCGAGAGFEGLYLKPARGCDPPAMKKSRAAFKRLYDKKAYAEAKALLKPIIDGCAKTLDWFEDGWIRNDLAITEYKLGNLAACQQILKPLADEASKTDEDLADNYPPADGDSHIHLIKATRANLKLCGEVKK
jgi:hypothetical protein